MRLQYILEQLQQFGFTNTQARLYIAGLELGEVLMKPLAQRANISRSTAYYLMEELQRRKFFTIEKIGKRKYYKAASPETLLEMVKKREKLITSLLPQLQVITKNKKDR